MEIDAMKRVAELTARIAALPKGYISQKTIGGKIYFYHQWSAQGKKQSKYLHDSEIKPLTEQIELRKRLQAELKKLRSNPQRNEGIDMKYTLMHKQIAVAEVELDEVSGFIQRIGEVYAPEHLPVGVRQAQGVPDRAASTSGGQNVPFPQAAPESGRHWKRWRFQTQRCSSCGASA